MNEQQRAILEKQMKLQRGAAIIEGTQDKFRADGYTNLLNKYGTKQDNSTAYDYAAEDFADDMQLVRLYEGNGLFTKIIDRPSEEAVKHGLDIDFGDEDIEEYVDGRLDELEFEDNFATAIKWSRLYGGAIIVMLVDDGRGLEEPLDWKNVRSIEELRVFERSIVQPDYTTLYQFHFNDSIEEGTPFGEPEYYMVTSIYGCFVVHRSRCLVFRNGRLPEQTTNANYRYWGIPEYVKIKRALRECITSHEDGVKLLERSVQAIYKMRNLSNMLSTDQGEDKVLQRLQVIDMARGILNSIAIDNDGEDYNYESLSMSGVKDILDATCNMLSAVTDIPQTILFGRSPAGMNSTGDGDMENYYNMVENIQKRNMKNNVRTLMDLILIQGQLEGSIKEKPKYKTKFAALWSMSESEKADVENKKASTAFVKAQTSVMYMETNVVDPSEVRKALATEGNYEIEELVAEEDMDLEINNSDLIADKPTEGSALHQSNSQPVMKANETDESDTEPIKTNKGAAVLIVTGGKILCGTRRNQEGICGPGGHVDEGESAEEAAVREAMEEFDILPLNLHPLGELKGSSGVYLPSTVFWTDEYTGTPQCDNIEMMDAQWLSIEDLECKLLFPPFEKSIELLVEEMRKVLTVEDDTDTMEEDGTSSDGGPGSGNHGHGGRKGEVGGSAPTDSNGKPYKRAPANNVSQEEYVKVKSDINNVFHARFKGKRTGVIVTYGLDDKAYRYKFESHGFDEYNIFDKKIDKN